MLYPIGIQEFELLRRSGYVYIDKTALVYKLTHLGQYYFFSRPRRFGKSLLVSTLESYFKGRKELFEGLDIIDLEKEWEEYPILHMDLNAGDYRTTDALIEKLNFILYSWEDLFKIDHAEQYSPPIRFERLINEIYNKTGKLIVVLVDEYDKPLLEAIGKDDLQKHYLYTLKAFYSVLKSASKYLKFVFLTGVTQFNKVSVFSDLNHLNDISMELEYAELCGITEPELNEYFQDSIKELAINTGKSYEETCLELKKEYGGYHFCRTSVEIYNPFSILKVFNSQYFGYYWFVSGTPTFLVKLLFKDNCNLQQLAGTRQSYKKFEFSHANQINPIILLYETGYLTICNYDDTLKMYSLDFPNNEVAKSFNDCLFEYVGPGNSSDNFINNFNRAINNGNADEFLAQIKDFLERSDYSIMGDKELYFQNVMFIIFKLMGYYVEVEHRTTQGRIDIVMKTPRYIYIFEIKKDGSEIEALQQIKDNKYSLPYHTDGRKIFEIGVNFSSKTRNIQNWKINKPKLSKDNFNINWNDTDQAITFNGNKQYNMITVEGGVFDMGATKEQLKNLYDIWQNEEIVHQVSLSRYMIGATEVTQSLWKAVMGNNPSSNNSDDDLPVENVSWYDCQEFIKKLNVMTGKEFRLPTEAEWEYAARGGKNSNNYQYAGSDELDKVAWIDGRTHCVATKDANELGLYDMSGNVWEWCNDWYDGNYYSLPNHVNPKGPDKGEKRVVRGGSYNLKKQSYRVAYRGFNIPDDKLPNLGLRLVHSI